MENKFSFELAKAGKPVCTRDGRKARIICFDARLYYREQPIIALVEDARNNIFSALGNYVRTVKLVDL